MTEPQYVLDATGAPIGVYRPNQDPNMPARFVEVDGNLFVDTTTAGVDEPAVPTPAPVDPDEG